MDSVELFLGVLWAMSGFMVGYIVASRQARREMDGLTRRMDDLAERVRDAEVPP